MIAGSAGDTKAVTNSSTLDDRSWSLLGCVTTPPASGTKCSFEKSPLHHHHLRALSKNKSFWKA
jgi:hypothetical protein